MIDNQTIKISKKSQKRLDNINDIFLHDVISNEKSLDLLMQHLGNEFSMECLLSLIEFIQFEQFIFDHIQFRQKQQQLFPNVYESPITNDNDTPEIENTKEQELEESSSKTSLNMNKFLQNGDNSINKDSESLDSWQSESMFKKMICNQYKINLPKSVAKSSIVFGTNGSNENSDEYNWMYEAKSKCHELFLKYVAIGSEYEINLAWKTRENLCKIMYNFDEFVINRDIDEWVLLGIFNSCAREMINLINGSFSRFKSNGDFQKLIIDYGISKSTQTV